MTKEEVARVMKVEGETRGFNIKHDWDYILETKGKPGLAVLEKEFVRWGHPLKYKEIKDMGFYPAGLRALSLLVIRDRFNFDDEQIKQVCAFHPKVSLVVKLFMRHFFDASKIMKEAPGMWRKYWTVGKFESAGFDLKKKYAVLRMKDFDLHPIFCACHRGYLETMTAMVLAAKKVKCEETKCTFRGDDCHEFLITWE